MVSQQVSQGKARAHLQLGALIVSFLALFIIDTSRSVTGAAVLPPSVEKFVPPLTIVLGIIVVAWTLYLFFPRREMPAAPSAGAKP